MAGVVKWVRAAGWVALTLVLAASRPVARQATVREWDDVVFGVSLHVFAPDARVPHPPYYPLHVGLGRRRRLAGPAAAAPRRPWPLPVGAVRPARRAVSAA